MLVRREAAVDVAAVRDLVGEAFRVGDAEHEPVEVRLLDLLRASDDWLPKLSLVAEASDGSVAGHVLCTRAWVGDRQIVGLGPLAVHPDHQGRGVGSALMHAVLAAAEACDVEVVGLLGSTEYYPRFGFVPAASIGIEAPEPAWGDHFQARVLTAGEPPRGTFTYARAFRELQ